MIKNNKIAIVLGVVCCILVISVFTQMKTVNNMENSVGTTLSANSELIDEVLSAQEDYDKLKSRRRIRINKNHSNCRKSRCNRGRSRT